MAVFANPGLVTGRGRFAKARIGDKCLFFKGMGQVGPARECESGASEAAIFEGRAGGSGAGAEYRPASASCG